MYLPKLDSNPEPLPSDYNPQIIGYFDEQGLLYEKTPWGLIEGLPRSKKPAYLAIYFDGSLVYIVTATGQILLNRCQNLVDNFLN